MEQAHLAFDRFIKVVRNYMPQDGDVIIKVLVKKFSRTSDAFVLSSEFLHLLEKTKKLITHDDTKKYVHLMAFMTELEAYPQETEPATTDSIRRKSTDRKSKDGTESNGSFPDNSVTSHPVEDFKGNKISPQQRSPSPPAPVIVIPEPEPSTSSSIPSPQIIHIDSPPGDAGVGTSKKHQRNKMASPVATSSKRAAARTPERKKIPERNPFESPGDRKLIKLRGGQKQIERLEKMLEDLRDKIEKLEEKELNLDDLNETDTSYILIGRYKQRFVKVWNKLCEVKGRMPSTGRTVEMKYRYRGSRYKVINSKVERYINKFKEFPDYHTIYRIVNSCNQKFSLKLGKNALKQTAEEVFVEVGKELQQRRLEDFKQNLGCHITDKYGSAPDPALFDADLRRKLNSNKQVAKSRMEEVINKYARRQEVDGDTTDSGNDEEEEAENEGRETRSASDEETEREGTETRTASDDDDEEEEEEGEMSEADVTPSHKDLFFKSRADNRCNNSTQESQSKGEVGDNHDVCMLEPTAVVDSPSSTPVNERSLREEESEDSPLPNLESSFTADDGFMSSPSIPSPTIHVQSPVKHKSQPASDGSPCPAGSDHKRSGTVASTPDTLTSRDCSEPNTVKSVELTLKTHALGQLPHSRPVEPSLAPRGKSPTPEPELLSICSPAPKSEVPPSLASSNHENSSVTASAPLPKEEPTSGVCSSDSKAGPCAKSSQECPAVSDSEDIFKIKSHPSLEPPALSNPEQTLPQRPKASSSREDPLTCPQDSSSRGHTPIQKLRNSPSKECSPISKPVALESKENSPLSRHKERSPESSPLPKLVASSSREHSPLPRPRDLSSRERSPVSKHEASPKRERSPLQRENDKSSRQSPAFAMPQASSSRECSPVSKHEQACRNECSPCSKPEATLSRECSPSSGPTDLSHGKGSSPQPEASSSRELSPVSRFEKSSRNESSSKTGALRRGGSTEFGHQSSGRATKRKLSSPRRVHTATSTSDSDSDLEVVSISGPKPTITAKLEPGKRPVSQGKRPVPQPTRHVQCTSAQVKQALDRQRQLHRARPNRMNQMAKRIVGVHQQQLQQTVRKICQAVTSNALSSRTTSTSSAKPMSQPRKEAASGPVYVVDGSSSEDEAPPPKKHAREQSKEHHRPSAKASSEAVSGAKCLKVKSYYSVSTKIVIDDKDEDSGSHSSPSVENAKKSSSHLTLQKQTLPGSRKRRTPSKEEPSSSSSSKTDKAIYISDSD